MSENHREAFYRERIRHCGPHYAHFDLLSTEAAVSLLFTYDIFHQITAKYLADFGLSKSTLNVLLLARHGAPQGILLHNLGELLLVSRANITGLIDHLEQKGLIKRVVDGNDRRARFARITEKGEELLDQVMPVHYQNVTELLGDLTVGEKEMLISLLKKTRSSLTAHAFQREAGKVQSCQVVQK